VVPPPDYFASIREICDRHDVLFIADEVITGFGRTGAYFAMEHWNVVPDLMTVAKGIGGGYAALGAVLVSDRVKRAFSENMAAFAHGFTYSNHPLSCAAALEVLSIIEEERLVEAAALQGAYLQRRLQDLYKHPIVGDVRGLGLLAGVELVQDHTTREPFDAATKAADRLFYLCLDHGVIIYPGSGMVEGPRGDQFLLCPPFIISPAQIDELVDALSEALDTLTHELSA
jgi:adenosylmethionine-8-amino-7-oxononanoate aminotransferase